MVSERRAVVIDSSAPSSKSLAPRSRCRRQLIIVCTQFQSLLNRPRFPLTPLLSWRLTIRQNGSCSDAHVRAANSLLSPFRKYINRIGVCRRLATGGVRCIRQSGERKDAEAISGLRTVAFFGANPFHDYAALRLVKLVQIATDGHESTYDYKAELAAEVDAMKARCGKVG